MIQQRQHSQVFHLPAPVGGLNSADPASTMPATDCLILYNMVPSQYGLRVRLGAREWCTGLGSGEPVRSIIPFTGSESANDKLFAATNTGIWDVTTSTATPTQVLAFSSSAGDAGWGNAVAFTSAAGGHFLLYADEENGLHVYEEDIDTWSEVQSGVGAGQISGVDPGAVVFVTAHKERVWLVEGNTANAYYLPVGAIAGVATKFAFGNKFKAGGDLVGLYRWTMDAGTGPDDYLCGVSRAGDVVLYQGTDPSDADAWAQRGLWYVGAVPAGRRIAADYGGDLVVLTAGGVIPMSKLVAGLPLSDPDLYATRKVGNVFQRIMADERTSEGWAILLHPQDSTVVVLVPQTDQDAEQLVMSIPTKGWARHRGLNMRCAGSFDGKLYFGGDGTVWVNDVYQDDQSRDGATAEAIDFSMLTAFQNFGVPREKRVQLVRPLFIADGVQPDLAVSARYDYDIREADGAQDQAPIDDQAWDYGEWDDALWADEVRLPSRIFGAGGMGTAVAVALKGSVRGRTTLVGFDVTGDSGGIL